MESKIDLFQLVVCPNFLAKIIVLLTTEKTFKFIFLHDTSSVIDQFKTCYNAINRKKEKKKKTKFK